MPGHLRLRHPLPLPQLSADVRKKASLAALILLAALAGPPAAQAAPGPDAGSRPARHQAGTTHYVDCAGGSDGAAGTAPTTAWRTLGRASAAAYHPGDRILFRRGTTCTGTFAPTDSGAAGAPLAAGAYGSGAAPRIAGAGARAAILLDNVEYWELRDLDVTNTGPATTTDRRAGVLVRLHDFGTGHHYLVDRVSVHDVNGADFKDPDPSGGILFAVQGAARPTRFDDVVVRHSRVVHTDRTGIGTSSTWGRRPEHPDGPGSTFAPVTGLFVHHNTVRDVGGDGIVVQTAVGARVEHNLVDGFNMRSAGYNAGIWAWNADAVRYQFNEVTGGHGTRDSMAYDIDGGNNGNVYQYNYSHDNDGGFLLICNGAGMTSDRNTVRYNVSVNDRNTSAPYGVISVVCGPATRTLVHNNTISTTVPGTAMVSSNGPGGVTFRDNLFAGRRPAPRSATGTTPTTTTCTPGSPASPRATPVRSAAIRGSCPRPIPGCGPAPRRWGRG
ncbi:right-handed parallel beta-helix repeat-containing protein [Streptomyces endophytica]|uniref:Right-handed parallel beta-helix repeat-containing protein n=1 Tax=Streptomyces endophytica TaxID=2991496 RepID=A0ABY6PGK6_9ACTN|nr:right-handed parallel beta-helix repeat-containing protein [Streptomyces endophytica]UZJ32911.1 right-handed parallel beta-helix repeat-containing protein [Streptomyces endophytica]